MVPADDYIRGDLMCRFLSLLCHGHFIKMQRLMLGLDSLGMNQSIVVLGSAYSYFESVAEIEIESLCSTTNGTSSSTDSTPLIPFTKSLRLEKDCTNSSNSTYDKSSNPERKVINLSVKSIVDMD